MPAIGAAVLVFALVVLGAVKSPSPDEYGCHYDADSDAWVSLTTPDGLCHDGPGSHYVSRYSR